MARGWGGHREGAGRKPDGYVPDENEANLEYERARHEKIKADERELKLSILRGDHLPRAMQRQAASTALAVLTQSMRSIPDNLERTMGLDPVVVDAIAKQIDTSLAEVAAAFKAMTLDA